MSTRKPISALAAIVSIVAAAIAPSGASADGRFGSGHFGGNLGGRGIGPRSPLYSYPNLRNPPLISMYPGHVTHVCTLKDCVAGTCEPC
jgi:hypothetical protein